MNEYLISAFDYTDANALERRLKARPFHFEMAKKLKEAGNFILGGAMLNEDGLMNGSTMLVRFESRVALDSWLSEEPYILMNVWEKISISNFKVADV